MANFIELLFLLMTIYYSGTMAVLAPLKVLNDGNKIPILALGSGNEKIRMRQAVNWAVEAGYRHIDTAELYGNEVEIGQGIADVIKKGIVKREDLFITTKLWNNHHARDQVVPALQESLKRLGLDYVDLYLIHSPVAQTLLGKFENIDYLDTWRGMEDAKKMGLTKSIGVSNFNKEQIERVLANCEIKPAVNQIEGNNAGHDVVYIKGSMEDKFAAINFQTAVNPTMTQEPLVSYCQSVGIKVMSYSPFGFMVSRGRENTPPPKIDDPTLLKIAQKYGKSTTQVVLRYLIDRGTIPIPKSANRDRIIQNINIFDFKLTDEEIATINGFNKNMRVIDITAWRNHPYYPF